MDAQVLAVHEQYIHMSILHRQTTHSCMFTAVYGLHTVDDRKVLWNDLAS